jgi:hypothetical protein
MAYPEVIELISNWCLIGLSLVVAVVLIREL